MPQTGQFPILVLHGREDVIALPRFGRRLARRLGAPCVELSGGHFIAREQASADLRRGRQAGGLGTCAGLTGPALIFPWAATCFDRHPLPCPQAAAVNALLRSFILGTSFLNVERYPFRPFAHWVDAVRAGGGEVEEGRRRGAARRLPRVHHIPCHPFSSAGGQAAGQFAGAASGREPAGGRGAAAGGAAGGTPRVEHAGGGGAVAPGRQLARQLRRGDGGRWLRAGASRRALV